MRFLDFWHKHEKEIFYPLFILCVAIISYCLGRISIIEKKREPLLIIPSSATSSLLIPSGASGERESQAALLVGSKNGSKYHFPWCSGASRIAEANKVYFKSLEEAKAKGYTPASNCPGLE